MSQTGALMAERRHFNRKRRIVDPTPGQKNLNGLGSKVQYVGSSYHKRSPGNFGLTPPAQPRPDKTLCDKAGIFTLAEAQHWLQEGVRRGMISATAQNGFPKHILAVTDDGVVLEANYNNEGPGHYHGYPLFEPDPFRQVVLKRWQR
jgi:hypothetical protein